MHNKCKDRYSINTTLIIVKELELDFVENEDDQAEKHMEKMLSVKSGNKRMSVHQSINQEEVKKEDEEHSEQSLNTDSEEEEGNWG